MTSVDHIQQSFVFIFILNVIITLLGRDRLIRTNTSSRTREKPDDVIVSI